MRTIFHRTVSNEDILGNGDSVDLFAQLDVFSAHKYSPFNSFRIVNNSEIEVEIQPEGRSDKAIKCPVGITTIPAEDNFLIHHPWLAVTVDGIVGVGEVAVEIEKVIR